MERNSGEGDENSRTFRKFGRMFPRMGNHAAPLKKLDSVITFEQPSGSTRSGTSGITVIDKTQVITVIQHGQRYVAAAAASGLRSLFFSVTWPCIATFLNRSAM